MSIPFLASQPGLPSLPRLQIPSLPLFFENQIPSLFLLFGIAMNIVSSPVQAKSRVLESICTGIRERYKALSLPPELALPEPQAVDVVADMTHPDQRAIGAAGRKVLAMFETISQFCQKAQQVVPFSVLIIIITITTVIITTTTTIVMMMMMMTKTIQTLSSS